jgi:hypothetical protein
MRVLVLALMVVSLGGCAKQVGPRVAGSEADRLDAASARLEELRLRGGDEGLSCGERCDVASDTCEVAEEVCEVGAGQPDREDVAARCIEAREQCAQARGTCTRCRAG